MEENRLIKRVTETQVSKFCVDCLMQDFIEYCKSGNVRNVIFMFQCLHNILSVFVTPFKNRNSAGFQEFVPSGWF